MTQHTREILGDDMDMLVTFDYIPGCPEVAPCATHGGIPADPPEVDIVRLAIRPHGYSNWIPTEVRMWSQEKFKDIRNDLADTMAWEGQ